MVTVLFWIVAISYGAGWIAAVPLNMEVFPIFLFYPYVRFK